MSHIWRAINTIFIPRQKIQNGRAAAEASKNSANNARSFWISLTPPRAVGVGHGPTETSKTTSSSKQNAKRSHFWRSDKFNSVQSGCLIWGWGWMSYLDTTCRIQIRHVLFRSNTFSSDETCFVYIRHAFFRWDMSHSDNTCLLPIRHVIFRSNMCSSDQTFLLLIRHFSSLDQTCLLPMIHIFFWSDMFSSDQTCRIQIRTVCVRSDMSASDQTSDSRWDIPSEIIRPILHKTLAKTDVLFQNRCPIWKKTSSGKKAPDFCQKIYCFMRKFHRVNGKRVALWEFLPSVGL